MTKRKNAPTLIKWAGPLGAPIKWKGPRCRELLGTIAGGEPTDEEKSAHASRYEAEMRRTFLKSLEKLVLLKQHFGIPDGEGSWISLALALAQFANIPGFKIQYPGEGRGRKHKPSKDQLTWTDAHFIALELDVQRIKKEQGFNTDIDALRRLASTKSMYNKWKPPRSEPEKEKLARSLNARLGEARRRLKETGFADRLDPHDPVLRKLFEPGSPILELGGFTLPD